MCALPLHRKSERAQKEWDDVRNALLSDPCLRRFNKDLRVYLLTDFCKDGFGYTVCQPGSDQPSLEAMRREDLGGDCEFLRPKTNLTLHPVSFGCRRTRGNECRLHSHLGEGFAGDWAINKCRLYTRGGLLSLGSRIATPCVSFSPMTVTMPPSCASRCGSCAGT